MWQTHASDAFDYSYDKVRDFLTAPYEARSFDWVITNPPFRLAEEFVAKARGIAKVGVERSWPAQFSSKASVGTSAWFAPHQPAVFAPSLLSAYRWSKADWTSMHQQLRDMLGLFGPPTEWMERSSFGSRHVGKP